MKRKKTVKKNGTFLFAKVIAQFNYVFNIIIDNDDRLREELKDLIDDNPIDEGSEVDDSDNSIKSQKRKSHDDEYLDDRLEDDDYDLIEENLGVKVERRVSSKNCCCSF